jgi:hypothetical protein
MREKSSHFLSYTRGNLHLEIIYSNIEPSVEQQLTYANV